MSKTRADEILDYAEREIRKNGFDGVSFRDIASAIGVKSASVHYHFPTKADLGAEVTKRYAESFIDGLGSPTDPSESAASRIGRLADAYIGSYRVESSTCLCAVLGSVVSHLPDETSNEVRTFYDRLGAWSATALEGSTTVLTPNLLISLLQGAMVLSLATSSEDPLLEARAHAVSLVS
ncbi:TetR/AcrR family transcriptional regulator [Ruegeria profundi]|uniref:HTH tetR-type domain-containing protein n=1 Tax=Ruegeria profundi TaxID=1685378 RepID=A0A0X3U0H6_9RHOB|nr:TetR/AcrR family transcriptional regulator [Ruegeria profundi]KUJ81362.1 hypothetical protein AVO44_05805 [Ruegeria profundi]